MKVIIIGGVAGGATAAARLRRLDERAEITIFEKGEHVSFANCGLPYHIGGAIPKRESLLLQTAEGFRARYNVDAQTLHEALAINRAAKTVSVKNLRSGDIREEHYDKLILAPGGAPVVPPIEGINCGRAFTLRNMADMDRIKAFIAEKRPRKAAVIGGGFIGMEMAENLIDCGLETTVVEMSSQVLAQFDADIICEVHKHMRERGVRLRLNDALKKIIEGPDCLTLELQSGAIEADLIVLAIGVRPDVKLAKEAGLEIGALGGIAVDRKMRSSDPDIYAAGDAVEAPDFSTGMPALIPLAGPANKQGRIAADNIAGVNSEYKGAQGSAVIKVFEMTAACTGMNEKTAKRLKRDYDKAFLWLPGHSSYYPGAGYMSMKIIFENVSGKILGAQIAGFGGVDKRCDALAVAIRAGMTARDLAALDLCYAPPYSSAKDPVNVAGLVIENALSGKVKNVHWHDVDGLPRDGSAILLDVRDPQEVAKGKIEGFINIPLNDLRSRLGELDRGKPVFAHCHSGMRSYVATRILAQKGFDARNIAGGYRLYAATKAP